MHMMHFINFNCYDSLWFKAVAWVNSKWGPCLARRTGPNTASSNQLKSCENNIQLQLSHIICSCSWQFAPSITLRQLHANAARNASLFVSSIHGDQTLHPGHRHFILSSLARWNNNVWPCMVSMFDVLFSKASRGINETINILKICLYIGCFVAPAWCDSKFGMFKPLPERIHHGWTQMDSTD